MSQKDIKNTYEKMAQTYDQLIDTKPYNAYYDRPNTLALLGAVKGLSILDAGCGPGKYAQMLLDKGAQVTGFDHSEQMVQLATARNKGRGCFFVHNMLEPLEMLETASFDKVLCALALHYVEDWNPVLQEFARVLKPQGQLVLSIGHPFCDYQFSPSNNYFELEYFTTYWKSFDQRVSSYRRSLQDAIMPLLNNGFYLEELLEYQPIAAFEAINPETYQQLQQFPAFMGMRAVLK